MTVLGLLTVPVVSLLGGWFVAVLAYFALYGSAPQCGFAGFIGAGSCGEDNPSVAPFFLASAAVLATATTMWWARLLRSFDAEDAVRTW